MSKRDELAALKGQPLFNRLAVWRDEATHLIYKVDKNDVESILHDLDIIRTMRPKRVQNQFGLSPNFVQPLSGMTPTNYDPNTTDQPPSQEAINAFIQNIDMTELVNSFVRKYASIRLLHSVEYFTSRSPPGFVPGSLPGLSQRNAAVA